MSVAPGAPNDFWVRDTSTHAAPPCVWTSTGDDGWVGQSKIAELRVSTEEISAQSFDEAQMLRSPVPGPTGNLETLPFEVPKSPEERTFHFAMKVVDNVGNRSEMRSSHRHHSGGRRSPTRTTSMPKSLLGVATVAGVESKRRGEARSGPIVRVGTWTPTPPPL